MNDSPRSVVLVLLASWAVVVAALFVGIFVGEEE